jgi:hypothetical protein
LGKLTPSKRSGLRRRNASRDYIEKEIEFSELNETFLDSLMHWSLKLSLIQSKHWYLLPDSSLILESTQLNFSTGMKRMNWENGVKIWTKFQRLYLKDCKGSQIMELEKGIKMKFSVTCSLPIWKLLSSNELSVDNTLLEPSMDSDFDETLKSCYIVNLPTVSIMESSKSLSLFKKNFKEALPQFTLEKVNKNKTTFWFIEDSGSDL